MARQHYYMNVLRKTIIQFLDVFNDIFIARYDVNGNVEKYIRVPIKLSSPETAFLFYKQWHNDKIMPMIGAQIMEVMFDPSRMVNKLDKIVKNTDPDGKTYSDFINPLPYTIDFQLSVMALNMVDIDQILEQILSFFSPYIFIKINIPEVDFSFDVKVIFNHCSPNINFERAQEDERMLLWDLGFSVHGYLFQPISDIKLIENIITKFYLNQERLEEYSGTETIYTSGGDPMPEEESIIVRYLGHDDDANILSDYYIFRKSDFGIE